MNTSIKRLSPILALTLGVGLLTLGQPAGAEYLKTFEGWKIYNSSCILCHGPQGRGDGALAKKRGLKAADFRARRQRLDGLSDNELLNEIKGNSGHFKGMPKWRDIYADPQLNAVVAYIRYLSRSSHPLEANPAEGQGLYRMYCTSCHGETGKGDGFMTTLTDIVPANHTDAARMDKYSNKQLVEIIKNGRALMPAWGGMIDDHHILEMVSYIRLLSHPSGR